MAPGCSAVNKSLLAEECKQFSLMAVASLRRVQVGASCHKVQGQEWFEKRTNQFGV